MNVLTFHPSSFILCSLHLQAVGVAFAELIDLGANYGAAVGLIGIIEKVILVVTFGRIELVERHNLGDDRATVATVGLQFGDYLVGDALLLRRVKEDCRAVLRANIGALPVERGWIVGGEKDLQNLAEADLIWIECDLNNFGMAGASRANRFIAWVCNRAAGIPGNDIRDAPNVVVDCLGTPETATAKRGNFG